ncbi:MAG: L7Ae/L30e/S12e/Gadd45 family ribosomal protein [Bacillota bacterium]
MEGKAYDFLGLAQRAGKVVSGEAGAEAHLNRGNAKLVILAEDASDRTKRFFSELAAGQRAPVLTAGTKIKIGMALGRSPRSVVVITDEGFARRLEQLLGDK